MSNVNTIVTIKFRREKKLIFLQAKFNEKFSDIKQRLLNYLDDVDNVDNIRLYNPQRELITDSLIVGFYNIKDYENLYLTLFNQETNSWEEINVPPFEDLRPLLPTDSSQMNERSMISPPNELGDNMDTDSDSDMDKIISLSCTLPLQCILLGTVDYIKVNDQYIVSIQNFIPYFDHENNLSSVINTYLNFNNLTVIGWCLFLESNETLLNLNSVILKNYFKQFHYNMIKNLLIKLIETNSNSEIDLVSELKLILEPLVGLIFSKQFKLLNSALDSNQNYMMNFNVYNCELEESTLNNQLNAVNDSSSDDFPIGHINLCEAHVEISELDINQKLFSHNEQASSILSSQTQHLTSTIPDTVQEKTQFLEEILGNLIDKEINTYSKNCQEYDSLVSYLTILNQPKEDLINQLNLLKLKDFLNLNLLLDKKI